MASYIPSDVLAGGELIAQTTAESVGREAPDLIDLGKVFAAHAEENVAGDATLQREAKFGPAGRRPVDGSTDESGASASHVQRPRPLVGKVDDLACVQGQDVRTLIPEPMLLVGTFQSLDPTIFDSETVAIFEESFIRGHHTLAVGNGATNGERVSRREAEGGAGQKLDSILPKPLIGADAEDG